jgi:hypothetical protein
MPTTQNTGALGKAVWLSERAAVFADEPIAPPGTLKIGRARSFVWKQSLELGKRVRERQFVSIKHVDNHERSISAQMLNTLHLVALGDNRISTE